MIDRYTVIMSDPDGKSTTTSGAALTTADAMSQVSQAVQRAIDKDNMNVKHVTIAIVRGLS